MSRLTLVPTPIGNLADITQRALEVLRSADVVAAEDTRHSRTLLTHHGIDTPMVRLDAHTIAERGRGVLERHGWVAFVTDAGTPGISDPGAELLRLALSLGGVVEVLPGPTAFVPALVLSGLPTARFTFEGFLPRKGSARRQRLADIAAATATSLVYEAPQRVADTLRELAEACGPAREASVSREISKLHETTLRGSLAELAARFEAEPARGEVVLVVGPAAAERAVGGDEARARALAGAGVRGRLLQRALVALGTARNEAYALALAFPEEPREADG